MVVSFLFRVDCKLFNNVHPLISEGLTCEGLTCEGFGTEGLIAIINETLK